ncbi:hypothetical protein [Novosphingobium sp. AAP1]|uniref:hypothetical protein n=1 Tax=Novosphingobium sp. AAP1 TaxID=1523413 RepID=UPI000A788CC1|nr:hypothetical protein [Novosphingobium sp. AAP1]
MDAGLRRNAHRGNAEGGIKLPLTGKPMPPPQQPLPPAENFSRLKCCNPASDLVKE